MNFHKTNQWNLFRFAQNDYSDTVMILSFRTDRPRQTVQTQIRLLLEEQSDQGLHCLPFRLHRLDSLVYGKATYIVVHTLEWLQQMFWVSENLGSLR